MTERDGYQPGVPCWVETWQEDPDTAATFYAGVFGWEVEKGTAPGTDTRYYMCLLKARAPATPADGCATCATTTRTTRIWTARGITDSA